MQTTKLFRCVTINVNGIRAAVKKGLIPFLETIGADVVCLQETRADHADLEKIFSSWGYVWASSVAQKRGYSGTAVLTRTAPLQIQTDFFPLATDEGRIVVMEFEKIFVSSIYFPSGTSSPERQAEKYRFMDLMEPILQAALQRKKGTVWCGDWNIAHTKEDLKNWRSNQKNSGFLPEERAWLDKVIGQWGYVDAFRVVNQASDQYTWWSHRGRAWDNNVGWRIDYHMITPDLRPAVKSAWIYKDTRFSDHAPVIVDYDLSVL